MDDRSELIRQIRQIELKTGILVEGLRSGLHHSVFRGQGIEFSEIREYVPGDDIRSIDWKVTARYNHPFVKEFTEERDQTFYFMADISGSGSFGSDVTKQRKILELVASLGFAALKNNDRVGLCLFSDRVEKFIPARRGKKHLVGCLNTLIDHRPVSDRTDLGAAARFLANVLTRKSSVIILSDFISPPFMLPLKCLRRRHEVIALRVTDEREREIPDVGHIELEDPETGEQLLVDTSDRAFRERYRALVREAETALARGARETSHPVAGADDGRTVRAPPQDLLSRDGRQEAIPWPDFMIRPGCTASSSSPCSRERTSCSRAEKKKEAIRFSRLAFVQSALGDGKKSRRTHLLFAIALAAIALLIVGLADPHIPLEQTREGVNVVLVIDDSGSMQAADYQPTRLEAAKSAAGLLIGSLDPKDYAGVVVFESGATTAAYLSPDKDRVREKLSAIAPRSGQTAIGDGLALAIDMAKSIPNQKNVVILLSDGVNNAGVISPDEAVGFATAAGIQVFTVGMGSDQPVVVGSDWLGNPEYARLDEATLQSIASKTGGKYFRSVDDQTLREIYGSLNQQIVREKEETSIRNLFFAGALVLLCLELWLRYGRGRIIQ